ncbi:LicD family protein [Niastella populi]|uniref:LicD/FKTN/FKRP nucleotidyltransferase domain-containing protein n=1 Tax=Niastella populi TaxID=550983 RepID=A0A1V9EJ98_9BACT|nr:LicD family protein [Niastella populi]OQP46207.1 hypothetical protein A4R26_32165 [Niastella populi]
MSAFYLPVYVVSFNSNGINSPSTDFRPGVYDTTHGPVEVKTIQCSDKMERDPEVSVDLPYLKEHYHLEVPPRTIDLFFTYRKIWKDFLSSSAEYCVVIEEDVQLTEPLANIGEQLRQLPADWDIFFPFDKRNRYSTVPVNDAGAWMEPHWASSILLEFFFSSSIFFISKPAAVKLLNIQKIPQPVYDKITVLTKENTIAAWFMHTNWFNLSSPLTLLQQRTGKIKDAILNFKVWNEERRARVRRLIAIASNTAKANNIDIVLHGGTLLGYTWFGEIIPWDDDVDFAIDDTQLDAFLALMSEAGIRSGHFFQGRPDLPRVPFYKIWFEDGEPINGRHYTFPFIDLWPYKADNGNIAFHNSQSFPNALTRPFKTVLFEEAELKMPHNPIECLDFLYNKQWRKRAKIDPWSHRLETVANFPLEMEIDVDEAGKIIFL